MDKKKITKAEFLKMSEQEAEDIIYAITETMEGNVIYSNIVNSVEYIDDILEPYSIREIVSMLLDGYSYGTQQKFSMDDGYFFIDNNDSLVSIKKEDIRKHYSEYLYRYNDSLI